MIITYKTAVTDTGPRRYFGWNVAEIPATFLTSEEGFAEEVQLCNPEEYLKANMMIQKARRKQWRSD